jgi:hypothetical protein
MSITKQDWPNWLPHMLWIHRQCPRCASVNFKPAEMRQLDELLSMFAVRPIRCLFCWRRYYWFAFHSAKPA